MTMSLHEAAKSGDVMAARRMVASGADMDMPDVHGHTPLHMAAGKGQVEVLKVLLEAGADKEAKTVQEGDPPLHAAAGKGDTR